MERPSWSPPFWIDPMGGDGKPMCLCAYYEGVILP